jgi:hypothetical protein
MANDPNKTPNVGEQPTTSHEEFRREAAAFLEKNEPIVMSEPDPQPNPSKRPFTSSQPFATSQPEVKAPWEKKADWSDSPAKPPKERSVLFPVALILLGGLALAYNFELIGPNFWYWLWRLWPVWLIIAGLDIVIGRRKRWFGWIALGLVVTLVAGSIYGATSIFDRINTGANVVGTGQSTPVDFPLEDAKEAEVRLSPGIAQLRVDATTAEGVLAQGTVYSPPGLQSRTNLTRQPGRAILSISQRDVAGINFGRFDVQPWDLHLSPEVPLILSVDGGVGRSDLDLRDLQVTNLSVKSGVGETQVTLPAKGKLSARIESGVGKTVLRIPRSMGAEIRTNTGIGGVSVHGTFDQNGRTYRTPGFDQSANQAEVEIDGGVGAIEIELID